MTNVIPEEDPMALAQFLGLPTAPPAEEERVITVTYSGPWVVKLTYFRETGKFYTEGEYTSKKLNLWEIWDELRDMLRAGKRPGLVDGKCEFYVLVEVPDHPFAHPRMIMPAELA